MSRVAAKYAEIFRISLQNQMAYIYDQILRGIFFVVVMFVFVQLWRTTYWVTGAKSISGFALQDMIWYLVMTETIALSTPRVHARISEEVVSGDLAYSLNRPFNYLGFHYFSMLGEVLVRAPVNFLIGAGVAYLLVGGFAFDWQGFGPVVFTFLLSLSIQFFMNGTIGLLAFWAEDVNGLFLLVNRAQWILGGMLLPIDIFPEALARVAEALPFKHLMYGPAKLMVKYSWAEFLIVVKGQVLWLAVFGVIAALVYRRGVSRVNVNGG